MLTPVAGSPFASGGTTPLELALDPMGKFLYTANVNSGNVSGLTVNSTTGVLTLMAGSPFAAAASAKPHGVAVDSSGKFVYSGNGTGGNVSGFNINATTGVLTPVTGTPFAAGTQPAGIVVIH